ncbi:antitoxin Xre-like helix-turn-helix domain-containing protein [Comamonas endophytica]
MTAISETLLSFAQALDRQGRRKPMLPALKPTPDAAVVLTKATLRAAEQLGLNNAELAAVIGISEATVSRLKANGRPISPTSKEGELALMLIRVFRSLDPLTGGDERKRRNWMTSYNQALLGQPHQLIRKADGLVRTLAYLDGMRAAT